ncbi:MAG: lysophospholipid acyltransferase family protein [Chthoniobacterales bacterium]|nr:lysophospholipid acyltransferase family protein [Chthoniobacterales bacterium]
MTITGQAIGLRAFPFWKRQRYRLEYWGLRLASALVCLLPWRAIPPLANCVGSLFFSLDAHRREVTIANLRSAFGERYSKAEYDYIGRKSYGVFTRTALELLWSSNLSKEVLDEIITTEGLDPMPSHGAEGRPALYFCLHAGNFEWLSQITCRHFGNFPVIAQNLKNPLLGPLFDGWRSALGQEIMPQKGAMLRTIRYLKDGGKMGMLIDLNLKPSEGPVVIRQFGRLLTPVTRLPAELALRTGSALVPVVCLPRKDGGYIVRYLPELPVTAESTPAEIAQACWDALEPSLQVHPELWLWSYKHWRYRPKSSERYESEGYPFYAGEYEPFQELIEKMG